MSKNSIHIGNSQDGAIIRELGNTIVCGSSGVGRTTLVKNIITSLYTLNMEDSIDVIVLSKHVSSNKSEGLELVNTKDSNIDIDELCKLIYDEFNKRLDATISDNNISYLGCNKTKVFVIDDDSLLKNINDKFKDIISSTTSLESVVNINFIIVTNKIDDTIYDICHKFKHIVLLYNSYENVMKITRNKIIEDISFYQKYKGLYIDGRNLVDTILFSFNDTIDRQSFDLGMLMKNIY